jgi:hypothetical protein
MSVLTVRFVAMRSTARVYAVAWAVCLAVQVSPTAAQTVAAVSRTEIVVRESAVVYSSNERLDMVARLAAPVPGRSRVDAARIELTLDVDGEVSSFVPFVLVVTAVEPTGPTGEFRRVSPHVARELIQQPGAGQSIRVDAAGLVRHWLATGGELYLRIEVDEPVASERAEESIRLAGTGGVLGKIVLIAR